MGLRYTITSQTIYVGRRLPANQFENWVKSKKETLVVYAAAAVQKGEKKGKI
jgi:hypothetical protein